MKKLSLYALSLMTLGLGFTSCDQLHNDLRLEVPTNYTLVTPENASQLIVFGATGSNVNNQWDVVTYNPYNVNTVVDFQVQVAKSESDFQIWDDKLQEAINAGESDTNFTDANGLPYATFVSGTFTSPSFTLQGADFCDAINSVYGFETNEQADAEPVQVAYRAYAWVPGVEYSFIFSNVVVLPQVQTYIPIRDPRRVYVIGACQGWDINSDAMFVQETEAGSNIYSGSINVAEGDFMFRFYTELGDWESHSLGSQEEDTPIEIEVTDDTYFGEVVSGKGSWSYPEWTGGAVDIELNLNDYTVAFTLKAGEEAAPVPTGKVLYLIGQPQGWNINSDEMWIQETENGSNIYKGTFAIKAGEFQFRFYSELGDWETNSVGSQNEDANVAIEFTNGVYTGPVVVYDAAADILGKGNWQDTSWETGYVEIEVNLNDYTITMTQVEGAEIPEEPTPEQPSDGSGIYLRGGMNDWGTDAAYQFEEVSDTEWTLTVSIPAGEQFKIADANWSAINLGGPGEEDGVVVTVGQDFSLVSNGKNLVLNENFDGTATLTLSGDNYTLLLSPAQ